MKSILQRIAYSKKDSDVIAKMKGTFVERPKRVKKPKEDIENQEDAVSSKKKKKQQQKYYHLPFIVLRAWYRHDIY